MTTYERFCYLTDEIENLLSERAALPVAAYLEITSHTAAPYTQEDLIGKFLFCQTISYYTTSSNINKATNKGLYFTAESIAAHKYYLDGIDSSSSAPSGMVELSMQNVSSRDTVEVGVVDTVDLKKE